MLRHPLVALASVTLPAILLLAAGCEQRRGVTAYEQRSPRPLVIERPPPRAVIIERRPPPQPVIVERRAIPPQPVVIEHRPNPQPVIIDHPSGPVIVDHDPKAPVVVEHKAAGRRTVKPRATRPSLKRRPRDPDAE